MATIEIPKGREPLLSGEIFLAEHGFSSSDPELVRVVVDHIKSILRQEQEEFYGTSLADQPGVEIMPLYQLLMALTQADVLELRRQTLGLGRADQSPIISFALAKTALGQAFKQALQQELSRERTE